MTTPPKPAPKLTPKQLKNFWAKVDKNGPGGCWLWTAGGNRYGAFSIFKDTHGAHQVSYWIHHGETPQGHEVLHKCDVIKCVNPDHLFSGTHQDNMADRGQKGRSARGENSGASKLTADQVMAIRKEYAAGGATMRGIAAKQGVSTHTVLSIIHGTTWKHLPVLFAKEQSSPIQIHQSK